jgi:hypothetical protein
MAGQRPRSKLRDAKNAQIRAEVSQRTGRVKLRKPKPYVEGYVERGRFTPDVIEQWREKLREFDGQRVDVWFERHQDIRSIYANNYWWGVCLKLVQDDTGNKADDMHEICLKKFLSKRKVEIISPVTGECEVHAVQERSSTRKISDFYQFVEESRLWFVEFFGVVTPDPDPEYWRVKGRRKQAA